MATIFWDVHGVLLVDFTPPGSTINAAAYQETKETQGGYLAQETRIIDQRTREFFCTTWLVLTVLLQL
jgi:hypothetical protein